MFLMLYYYISIHYIDIDGKTHSMIKINKIDHLVSLLSVTPSTTTIELLYYNN